MTKSKFVVCYKVKKNQTIAHLKELYGKPRAKPYKKVRNDIESICSNLLAVIKATDELINNVRAKMERSRWERKNSA